LPSASDIPLPHLFFPWPFPSGLAPFGDFRMRERHCPTLRNNPRTRRFLPFSGARSARCVQLQGLPPARFRVQWATRSGSCVNLLSSGSAGAASKARGPPRWHKSPTRGCRSRRGRRRPKAPPRATLREDGWGPGRRQCAVVSSAVTGCHGVLVFLSSSITPIDAPSSESATARSVAWPFRSHAQPLSIHTCPSPLAARPRAR